jgi:hypothetical protein
MNINRNNYEEYFLLYTDKELSVEEKSIVEMFVSQNADLEEEFIMLQQSVVKPDTSIRLADKNSLYKSEGFIDETNYKEKFLLYNDNELSLDEIEDTEKFVLSNPSLQKEFSLLQQVKYEPDTSIVFPGKSSLYKKENDDTKVISLRWKALAAAVLLGIGLWTGISYLQSDKADKEVATKQTKVPTEKITVKAVEPKELTPKDSINNLLVTTTNNTKAPKSLSDNHLKKQTQLQQNVTVKNIQPFDKPEVNIVEKKPVQKKEDVAIDVPKITEVRKSNELPQPINITTEPNDKTTKSEPVVESSNYVKPASYIADAEVKSENYIFYNITTEEFKKSKVGNFLKKVKRVIESKIPFKNNGFKSELPKDN